MAIKINGNTVITDSRTVTGLGAPIGVDQGGTGAATLTGVLVGNGTSAVTAITQPAGDLVGTTATQTLTNKSLTSPTISGGSINNAAIGGTTAAAGTFTALTATGTTSLAAVTTSGNVTLGDAGTDTTTIISQLSANSSVGSSGQVLSSRGANNSPQWVTIFPAGTAMLFAQTAAPTGWTKSTTHDNKALRVVSGTAGSGGSVAFTAAFASQSVAGTVGNTTLTLAQIPAHTHTVLSNAGLAPNIYAKGSTGGIGGSVESGSAGGGGSHTHSFTGTAINLAVQYVDVIIATKD